MNVFAPAMIPASSLRDDRPASLPDIEDRAPSVDAITQRIRIVGLPDRNKFRRIAWLAKWLDADQVADYQASNTRILSQVHASFDALLLHGEDLTRMVRIARTWREILARKAILVAMPAPDTAQQVELLRAGADAVIDILAPPALACAQVQAVLRRTSPVSTAGSEPTAWSVKTRTTLSTTRQIILDAVLAGRGQPVPRTTILGLIGKPDDGRSRAALRVQINQLNALLRNAHVKSRRGSLTIEHI